MAETKVTLKYLRMAPRKVRLVSDLIKGLPVNEAEAQLLYERRRAAKPILKLLRSAVTNAKALKMDSEKLKIVSVRVDQGPMLKRMLPRARGSASAIQKKMSHVTLVLGEDQNIKPKRFTIVVEKKIKKPEGERPSRKKTEKHEHEEAKPRKESKPGFFQKVFRRKSISK